MLRCEMGLLSVGEVVLGYYNPLGEGTQPFASQCLRHQALERKEIGLVKEDKSKREFYY